MNSNNQSFLEKNKKRTKKNKQINKQTNKQANIQPVNHLELQNEETTLGKKSYHTNK